MNQRDGMNYAPESAGTEKVVGPGEFPFAAAFLDHGHINGQVKGLLEAGGECRCVYDPQPERAKAFAEKFGGLKVSESFEEILEDPEIQLVAGAAVPSERCGIGLRVLEAGKDYFTDKSPFTTLAQLEQAKEAVERTGRKYMCYYSERIHTEAGFHAGELIRQGAIGDILQVLIMAPHNLNKPSRPDWFFDKEKYGGILTDIGSHQFEQFLTYTGAKDAKVRFARVANFANADKPGLEDFGEASLEADNGASCYCRLDWFNPKGLRTWGDGRTFILGTKGTMEVRKYIDLTSEPKESQVIYLVDEEGEKRIPCAGKVGFPFFGQLIRDILDRSETAMTQDHCFKAAELAMRAQAVADGCKPA
jgi:predicted dehydrogenase